MGDVVAACVAILAVALTGGWARDRWLDWRYRARFDADTPDPVRLAAERLVYETEAYLREETAP